MAENYSYTKYDSNTMARAKTDSAPVSTKHSIEICNFLKGKNTKVALSYLDDVLAMEKAIPFKRFNGDVGHRTSVKGPGRYPVKAVAVAKRLIESAVSNASSKGLNTENLVIVHMKANEGARPFHHGRQRRQQMKRTHFELVILEKLVEKKVVKKKSAKKTETKAAEKAAPKKEATEAKKENKAEVKKEAPKKEAKPEAKKEAKTAVKADEEAPKKEAKAEEKKESKE